MDINLILGQPTSPSSFPVAIPLSKAPHILIAGMTGSGKSVLAHSLITQLAKLSHWDANLLLIDPKRVEYSRYRGLKHLLLPPAYEMDDIEHALRWACHEMRSRFSAMEQEGARSIDTMNDPWARIVIFIDEMANLMLLSGRKMEEYIVTLASMGRAAGVHLILSTQRPSADVITGLIRANVPTRVCLPVVTAMESRIILDAVGGEQLTQPGSMLIRMPGTRDLIAAQAPLLTDSYIDTMVATRRATP